MQQACDLKWSTVYFMTFHLSLEGVLEPQRGESQLLCYRNTFFFLISLIILWSHNLTYCFVIRTLGWESLALWSYFCVFIMQSKNRLESKTLHTQKFMINVLWVGPTEFTSLGQSDRSDSLAIGSNDGEDRAGAKKINAVLAIVRMLCLNWCVLWRRHGCARVCQPSFWVAPAHTRCTLRNMWNAEWTENMQTPHLLRHWTCVTMMFFLKWTVYFG